MTVVKVKTVVQHCFKCNKVRPMIPGHKVCGECHDPVKCHTCNKEKQNAKYLPKPERNVT